MIKSFQFEIDKKISTVTDDVNPKKYLARTPYHVRISMDCDEKTLNRLINFISKEEPRLAKLLK